MNVFFSDHSTGQPLGPKPTHHPQTDVVWKNVCLENNVRKNGWPLSTMQIMGLLMPVVELIRPSPFAEYQKEAKISRTLVVS